MHIQQTASAPKRASTTTATLLLISLLAGGGFSTAANAQTLADFTAVEESITTSSITFTWTGLPSGAIYHRAHPGEGVDCPSVTTDGAPAITAAGYGNAVATNFDPGHIHTITGLEVGTRYCFILTSVLSTLTTDPVDVSTLDDQPPTITDITGPAVVDEDTAVALMVAATDTDADGGVFTALTYRWEQVENADGDALTTTTNRVTLAGDTTATARFTTPEYATDGTRMLYFRVTVTGSGDPGGTTTEVHTLAVAGENDPPMFVAGEPLTATASFTVDGERGGDATARAIPPMVAAEHGPAREVVVTLTARGAHTDDVDGDNPDTMYAWSCEAVPAVPIALAGDNPAVQTFAAPALPDGVGSIAVTCTAMATATGIADSQRESVVITVRETAAGGNAVGEAVLPNVLRGITDTIHKSIYDRIRHRQVRDGFWKP